MERRRLQLANSHDSGGTSLEFPIYLVSGDNGQVGVDLFEYIISSNLDDESIYWFSENEIVYVTGVYVNGTLTDILLKGGRVTYDYYTGVADGVSFRDSQFGDITNKFAVLLLKSDGRLTVISD